VRAVYFPSYTSFPSLSRVMERIRSEMDHLFADFMRGGPLAADTGTFPALNVIEEGDKILIHAQVPGVEAENIEISVQGNTLSVRGERGMEQIGDVKYHRRERAAGNFQRAVRLPAEIDADAVEATCEHGVLKLVLPKIQAARMRKIPISRGQDRGDSTSIVDI